jgi:ketosteroid isomerase-like protein
VLFTPADLVREIYARLAWHDVPGVLALLSPEVEITQTTELPWGGRFTGAEGAKAFFTQFDQHTDGVPESLTYIPAGEDVAVTGRLRGRTRVSGRLFDLDLVHIWTLKQGKAVRCAAFMDTSAMRAALATG